MKPPPGLGHLLLGQPDLAEQFMRALALKGQLPSYLGAEFEPSITVLDLGRIEYAYLRREQVFQGGALQGALAANFNYITLGLIATGRGVCVVDQIVLLNTSAAAQRFAIYLNQNATIGSAGTLVSARDDRVSKGTPARSGIFGVGATQDPADVAAGLFGVVNVLVPAGQTAIFPCGYVLTGNNDPSNGQPIRLTVQTTTVNLSSAAYFNWRERAGVASEFV